jgi:protein-tyrosine-phosphatase
MSPSILIVGGAATGRVPMTAALLARLLSQRGLAWNVYAGGVVAHDDDPAEVEARDAMLTLGLDISDYRAQPITDELITNAAAIVAVDSGSARVIRARYADVAARVTTLGELSGRARDIPDPFRMQIGAWITYAREIETLLKAGMRRLLEMVGESDGANEVEASAPQVENDTPRRRAVEHCEALLRQTAQRRDEAAWPHMRQQIIETINEASAQPLQNDDLAVAYGALLKALLNLAFAPPNPGQISFLSRAIGRMRAPIDQQAISQLSNQMGNWTKL